MRASIEPTFPGAKNFGLKFFFRVFRVFRGSIYFPNPRSESLGKSLNQLGRRSSATLPGFDLVGQNCRPARLFPVTKCRNPFGMFRC